MYFRKVLVFHFPIALDNAVFFAPHLVLLPSILEFGSAFGLLTTVLLKLFSDWHQTLQLQRQMLVQVQCWQIESSRVNSA